jgi:hypothetical protein
VLLLLANCGRGALGAAPSPFAADYERARSYGDRVRNKVFRERVVPQWNQSGDGFWYRVETGPQTHEFVVVDIPAGERRLLMDHARLAARLGEATGRDIDPKSLPLDHLRLAPGGLELEFSCYGQDWRYHPQENSLSQLSAAAVDHRHPHRGVRILARPRPSTNGVETQLEVVNRLNVPLRLEWVDHDGSRRAYGAVAPRQTFHQHTFANHVWIVSVNAAAPLAIFQATAESGRVVIHSDEPLPPSAGSTDSAARGRGDRVAPRRRSPDGKYEALIHQFNVTLRDLHTQESHPLTSDGTAEDPYDGRCYWSPDSLSA